MNARHAAALALVSFYLLTPPMTQSPVAISIHANLPLSEWENQGTFDTKEECERGKAEIVAQHPTPTGYWEHWRDGFRSFEGSAMRLSQCISSDDPRLKEK